MELFDSSIPDDLKGKAEDPKRGYTSLMEAYSRACKNEPDREEAWAKACSFALDRSMQYAAWFGVHREEVLRNWEIYRGNHIANYYVERRFPDLTRKDVFLYKDYVRIMKEKYGGDLLDVKLVCPKCHHVQTPRDFSNVNINPSLAFTDCFTRFAYSFKLPYSDESCKWTQRGQLQFDGEYVILDNYMPLFIFRHI